MVILKNVSYIAFISVFALTTSALIPAASIHAVSNNGRGAEMSQKHRSDVHGKRSAKSNSKKHASNYRVSETLASKKDTLKPDSPKVLKAQSKSTVEQTKHQSLKRSAAAKDSNGHGKQPKVTLCHATGSTKNPYVKITVAAAGSYNGHDVKDHQHGEDIIPPYVFKGKTYSQNWNADGKAIFDNACDIDAMVAAYTNSPEPSVKNDTAAQKSSQGISDTQEMVGKLPLTGSTGIATLLIGAALSVLTYVSVFFTRSRNSLSELL